MKIAGYSKISATSYGLSLDTYTSTVHSNYIFDSKMYLSVFLNKYRCIGLVDSGSDITIIHFSLFEKIFGKFPRLEKSDISSLASYSNHVIKIQGMINCLIKLNSVHIGILTKVYVIMDVKNGTPLLLGKDFLKNGMGCIAYTGDINKPDPEIIFQHPVQVHCKVFYVSPREQYTCTAECLLQPEEMSTIDFYLNSAAPVIRTDIILITAQQFDKVLIVPSRTDLTYNIKRECYVATARVINMTKQLQKLYIKGKFELINSYDTVSIGEDRENFREVLSVYPLGRELLPTNTEHHRPSYTVQQIDTAETFEVQVSDLDYADAVYLKEPTYTGEAHIEADIIEPYGLDLPTIVHDNAEQAVNLDSYSEEIRPYIKRIFIDKYPQVVSLHALDAGNLSLTLGYTQLRLRENETLPRSKRIFHISPSDQRHLDDICDLLIKFGYICRSPISPTGHHLYGMSAYLVPRSKPNTLGRLIVDFSPVNQLIESPSAVIPEINATLQFLKNKALFTSLDLRYAYLALRIDALSRPLTTFLTPTGSFQWLSLPTGAANSPAYFTEAANKILHYEPVLDSAGNPVYESENVVKQKRSVLKDVVNFFDDIIITSILKPTYKDTLDEHFGNLEVTIKRLAFHGAKISVPKCEFAKSKILFLGWYVTQNYVIADPRRIQKVREFCFPDSKKAVRAFLGLVNSLRRVVQLDVIKQIALLTPLTSSKNAFEPTEVHKKALMILNLCSLRAHYIVL